MFLKLNATFPHGGRECFPSSFPIAISRSPWELFNATIRFLSLGTSKCNRSSLIYSGRDTRKNRVILAIDVTSRFCYTIRRFPFPGY